MDHNKDRKSLSSGISHSPPRITIRGGVISLNSTAGDLFLGAAVRFVHLLVDGEKGKFAIGPVPKDDENAFTVSVRRDKRGARIAAKSFLNYIGWKADKPVILDVQWNSKEQIMEAFLPKEHVRPMAKSGKPARLL